MIWQEIFICTVMGNIISICCVFSLDPAPISRRCQVVVLFRVFRGSIVSSSNEPRNRRNTRNKTQSGRTKLHLKPVGRGNNRGHLQGGELSDHGVLLRGLQRVGLWLPGGGLSGVFGDRVHKPRNSVRAPGGARPDLQGSWTEAEVLCR